MAIPIIEKVVESHQGQDCSNNHVVSSSNQNFNDSNFEQRCGMRNREYTEYGIRIHKLKLTLKVKSSKPTSTAETLTVVGPTSHNQEPMRGQNKMMSGLASRRGLTCDQLRRLNLQTSDLMGGKSARDDSLSGHNFSSDDGISSSCQSSVYSPKDSLAHDTNWSFYKCHPTTESNILRSPVPSNYTPLTSSSINSSGYYSSLNDSSSRTLLSPVPHAISPAASSTPTPKKTRGAGTIPNKFFTSEKTDLNLQSKNKNVENKFQNFESGSANRREMLQPKRGRVACATVDKCISVGKSSSKSQKCSLKSKKQQQVVNKSKQSVKHSGENINVSKSVAESVDSTYSYISDCTTFDTKTSTLKQNESQQTTVVITNPLPLPHHQEDTDANHPITTVIRSASAKTTRHKDVSTTWKPVPPPRRHSYINHKNDSNEKRSSEHHSSEVINDEYYEIEEVGEGTVIPTSPKLPEKSTRNIWSRKPPALPPYPSSLVGAMQKITSSLNR